MLLFGVMAIVTTLGETGVGDPSLAVAFSNRSGTVRGGLSWSLSDVARRTHRLCHQPGARPRAAHSPRRPHHSRQRWVDWGTGIPVIAPIVGGIVGALLFQLTLAPDITSERYRGIGQSIPGRTGC